VTSTDHQKRYEALLRRYLQPLRRLAWSYARDGFEDLFQEIAMALWTYIEDADDSNSILHLLR